jgi:DNA-binding transcriptional LysR family regulator
VEYHPFQPGCLDAWIRNGDPLDRLEAMRLFVRVVECGSFSAVAREAGVGQPAVSKQIAALEAHLGAPLVLRSSRRITVTQAGQTFYESAVRLVQDLEAAESSVGKGQSSPAGLVRLTAAPVLGRLHVVPLLPRFLERYPDIVVELSASERHVDLIGEGIDLAVRHGPLEDSALTARRVASAHFVTAATPAYFAAHGRPTRPADLDTHACIAYAPRREVRPWRFLAADGSAILHHPKARVRTGDAEQIRAAVLCGLGIAHGPSWLFAPEIASGEVVTVLRRYQPEPQPISLVHPAGRRPTAKVQVLMDYLAQALAKVESLRR